MSTPATLTDRAQLATLAVTQPKAIPMRYSIREDQRQAVLTELHSLDSRGINLTYSVTPHRDPQIADYVLVVTPANPDSDQSFIDTCVRNTLAPALDADESEQQPDPPSVLILDRSPHPTPWDHNDFELACHRPEPHLDPTPEERLYLGSIRPAAPSDGLYSHYTFHPSWTQLDLPTSMKVPAELYADELWEIAARCACLTSTGTPAGVLTLENPYIG